MNDALKRLFVIVLALSVLSCSRQKIVVKDYEFFGDKGRFGATKVWSLSTERPGVKIPKSQWDEIRIGMVCTKAENITDIQTNIDKLCAANTTTCWYVKEEFQKIQAALAKIQEAAKIEGEKK